MISNDRKRKAALDDRGYQLVQMNHGTYLDPVSEIVQRRFEIDEDTMFPIDEVYEEDYLKLIDRCVGNIYMILDTFQYAETLRKWDSSKDLSKVIGEAGY